MRSFIKIGLFILFFGFLACGPIPQPFQVSEQKKSDTTLLFAPESTSVVIKGISGPVGWVGTAFSKALAESLRKRDVLASSKWQNDRSLILNANGYQQLYENRPAQLVITWVLTDFNRKVKGIHKTTITPPKLFWTQPSDEIFRNVAELKADIIIKWLKNPVAPVQKKVRPPTIKLNEIKGATPKQSKALIAMIANALTRNAIDVSTSKTSNLILQATLFRKPVDLARQYLKITWILSMPNKKEVGRVSQINVIENAKIEDQWNELANDIAFNAIDGIIDLIDIYKRHSATINQQTL